MLRCGAIAVLLLLPNQIFCGFVEARERPTYFIVDNPDDTSIHAWMRPTGQEDWKWHLNITPRGHGEFGLYGYESVDILIVRHGGQALYFPKAKLNALIRDAGGRRQPSVLEGQDGRIVKENGVPTLVLYCCACAPSAKLQARRQVAPVNTSSSCVTLKKLSLVCKESDDPYPPAPQSPPKNPNPPKKQQS
jgi:hypothetical protein